LWRYCILSGGVFYSEPPLLYRGGVGKMASWSTKAATSLKRVKIPKSYYGGPIGSRQRSFKRHHSRPPTPHPFLDWKFATPATNANCYHISSQERIKLQTTASMRKKPIKNFWEKGVWAYPGTDKIWGYPLSSQERVKLRTSNFVSTFIGSIGTKAH